MNSHRLEGEIEHKDSVGNRGVIRAGGVQWMTAGRGIIHSEMPRGTDGMLWGFQLWINLPAKDKMCKPRYQDYQVQGYSFGTLRYSFVLLETSPLIVHGGLWVLSQ